MEQINFEQIIGTGAVRRLTYCVVLAEQLVAGVDADGKRVKGDVVEETLYLLLVDPQVLCVLRKHEMFLREIIDIRV